jgi:ketosteroid isomerase-like protein
VISCGRTFDARVHFLLLWAQRLAFQKGCSLKIHALSFLLVFALLAAIKPSLAQSVQDSNISELQRLETVWNEAHEHGDANALEALWADDLQVAVPRMPVMNKAEAIHFARSGQMRFLRYATSDLRIRVYGNAAVVTGRMQRIRVVNGRQTSDDWRFTKVYVRQVQKWRVVAFHASEAAQP